MGSNKFLPELPDHTPEEKAKLKASIARWGVLPPVVKDEHGNFISGQIKQECLDELRAEGALKADAQTAILPGLTDAEKSLVALDLATTGRQDPKRRDELIKLHLRLEHTLSTHQLGELADCDHKTASKIKKKLIATGEIPQSETIKAKNGKTYRPRQGMLIVNTPSAEKQSIAGLAKLTDEDKEKHLGGNVMGDFRFRRIVRNHQHKINNQEHVPAVAGVDIRHGSFQTALTDIQDEDVALVGTDAEWSNKAKREWPALAQLVKRVLKPGGWFFTYCGVGYLDDFMAAMRTVHPDVVYKWLIPIVNNGFLQFGADGNLEVSQAEKGHHGEDIHGGLRFRNVWSPILCYRKKGGEAERPGLTWEKDMLLGTGKEKDLYVWQQPEPEFRQLIEMFSNPGDLVVDPFIGSGTCCAAALKSQRRFIGCDIQNECVNMARERCNAVLKELQSGKPAPAPTIPHPVYGELEFIKVCPDGTLIRLDNQGNHYRQRGDVFEVV